MNLDEVTPEEEIDYLKNIGIRAGRTFMVTFASVFISGVGITEVDYAGGLTAAAIASVVAIAQGFSGLPENIGTQHSKWIAVVIRALKTFFQTVIGMMGTTLIYSFDDLDWLNILAVSTTAAIGSFVFGLLSVLPEEKPPATIS